MSASPKSSAAWIPTLRREADRWLHKKARDGLLQRVGIGVFFKGWLLQRSAKQPDVGRQTRQQIISSRFKESRVDAEHWVGGILEFAHSGISKTHTRLGGVSERSLTLVLAKS